MFDFETKLNDRRAGWMRDAGTTVPRGTGHATQPVQARPLKFFPPKPPQSDGLCSRPIFWQFHLAILLRFRMFAGASGHT